MLHNTLIVIHAMGGAVALIVGALAIRPRLEPHDRSISFTTYASGLAVLVVTTVAVVAVDWPDLDGTERAIFAGLIVLAVVMGIRAALVARQLRQHRDGWNAACVRGVGFTLIALFDGFVIVAAIDLGAPGWLVAIVGVAAVVLGRRVIHDVEAGTAVPS